MSIEVPIRDLLASISFFNQVSDMRLRGKVSFKIARAIKFIQPELDTYNEEFNKLRDAYYEKKSIEELGEEELGEIGLTEAGTDTVLGDAGADVEEGAGEEERPVAMVIREGKTVEEFAKEVDDLLDTTVTLPFGKIDSAAFDSVEIEPNLLTGVIWLFKE